MPIKMFSICLGRKILGWKFADKILLKILLSEINFQRFLTPQTYKHIQASRIGDESTPCMIENYLQCSFYFRDKTCHTLKKHFFTNTVISHFFVSIIEFTNLQIDVAQLLKNLYVANEVIVDMFVTFFFNL